jgi:hypothetical protein
MLRRIGFVAATSVALFLTSGTFAAVRLTYTMTGGSVPLVWPSSSFPIRYRIDRRLATAIAATPDVIDRAFNAWSTVTEANLSFQPEGAIDGVKAGFDQHNSISMIDGLYKDQGFIAVTTNWYDDQGHMTEADIQLDPSVLGGTYNVQQTVEHEVGHLLGLDHSAVLTSVMYPYVNRGGTALLDSDDRVAITSVYPKINPTLAGATLSGRVVGDQGGVFAAQVVAVSDRGEPVATSLTNPSGEFLLQPVPAGTYRLYAEPLDGPVDPRNLAGVWRDAKVVSFPTQFLGGAPMRVEDGRVYGNLILTVNGAPVRLNPKWIGACAQNHVDLSLTSAPVTIKPGQTLTIAVGGDGFTSGMTTFEVLNPSIKRVSECQYASNYVFATFTIEPDASPGSAVILVRSGNETATLTGALRVDGPNRARAVHS